MSTQEKRQRPAEMWLRLAMDATKPILDLLAERNDSFRDKELDPAIWALEGELTTLFFPIVERLVDAGLIYTWTVVDEDDNISQYESIHTLPTNTRAPPGHIWIAGKVYSGITRAENDESEGRNKQA